MITNTICATYVFRAQVGSWPLFVNAVMCPDQIQRPAYCTQSFAESSNGFLLQGIFL
jgi:hypothetical protein